MKIDGETNSTSVIHDNSVRKEAEKEIQDHNKAKTVLND